MRVVNNFDCPAGATPLDPDELRGLKLHHITTREELNRFEQDNINDALQWLANRRRSDDILTEKFIKTLHKKMFGKVWQWAGTFRRSGKNIGVDWAQFPFYLRTLLNDVQYWIDHQTYPPDEIGVRFHHRVVSIHLFTNGNGRHARLMTDLLLERILGGKVFTWHSKNLADGENVRNLYIEALKKADRGDYSILLTFVRSE